MEVVKNWSSQFNMTLDLLHNWKTLMWGMFTGLIWTLNFPTLCFRATVSAANAHTFLTKHPLPRRRFSDSILATILATKSDMCGKKFELKIDNVRFVGHPTLLQHPGVIQVGDSSV